MRLVIFGNANPVKLAIDALDGTDIKVLSVEQDKILPGDEQEDFEGFLSKKRILLNKFRDISKYEYDMIFVCNYNKIIKVEEFKNHRIINLHIGILPKYRGNNANASAILNGEDKVGYTIHEVIDELDGGDIFYCYECQYKEDETYYNAKIAIDQDIRSNLPKILSDINDGFLPRRSQKGKKFVYCSKIRPDDGVIKDWNISTETLIRKLYIFGRPLGSGLKFIFKEKIYEIAKMSRIDLFDESIGIPGAIVNIVGKSCWIKTADTAIAIDQLLLNGEVIDIKLYFKIGNRL